MIKSLLKRKKFNRFFTIQWHVTDSCDQRCQHCYIYNQKQPQYQMHSKACEQNWEKILNNFRKFCRKAKCDPFISLTGGDPLLFPQFWPLAKKLKKYDIPFSILGNPFHLTPEVCRRLKELGCIKYQMSLDGMEKTHDSFRKPGSFKATLNAYNLLHKAGIQSVVMSTVSKSNYIEIPDLTEFIVDKGIQVFAFARYCPTHDDIDQNIAPDDYRKFLDKMYYVFNRHKDRGTIFRYKDHLWQPYLFEEGHLKIEPKTKVQDGCHCAISHMTVLPDGTVYACRRFESPVGKVPDQSFAQIFLNKKMTEYRNVKEIDGCKDCQLLNYCRGCRAVAYGTYQNYFARDPQCWR